MKNFKFIFLTSILFAVLSLNSCKDDDVIDDDVEELITTLTYTLTPTSGDVVTLSFSDIDGDGGNDPIIIGGTLQANMTYTGSLDLQNESETPAESITEEIAEEDLEHQFFFATGGGLDLTVAYGDQDSEGNPLGLATSLVTSAVSTGTLNVILRHEPAKGASGVSSGDITNAGGETDIEVTFDITIQ
ncbi:MAG: type 1 periplasmic binding fold superfamily protein [Saprospiraceae bacterium]